MSTVTTEVRPWRTFSVSVRALRPLSPSFMRVTFAGEDLDRFADNGFDLRLKLILPAPNGGLSKLPTGADWYSQLRALPADEQCPVRTYTTRAVRHDHGEVDVDIVLHPDYGKGLGPAAKWATAADIGDEIVLLGPNRDFDGVSGGIDFQPPDTARRVLLAGDETAVPAVAGILERLPRSVTAEVVLEVPHDDDATAIAKDLPATSHRVRVLARDGTEHGAMLDPAVRQAVSGLMRRAAPTTELEDIDVDSTLLWEVPGGAAEDSHGLYAWLAGEAGVIKTLRRHLVSECGINRKAVAFMGYWRLGRPEGG